jgi:poly(A) polymerase
MGVHSADGDMDVLCIGPAEISRARFFDDSGLIGLLAADPLISSIKSIPDAYMPLIKFKIDRVDIDLLYAPVPTSKISPALPIDSPPNAANQQFDIFDSSLVKCVDEVAYRALNACRVSELFLSLVPSVENFRVALRLIKYWAHRRGIYSNIYGFLGGCSWAILVARTCQLNPDSNPAQIIAHFFQFVSLFLPLSRCACVV